MLPLFRLSLFKTTQSGSGTEFTNVFMRDSLKAVICLPPVQTNNEPKDICLYDSSFVVIDIFFCCCLLLFVFLFSPEAIQVIYIPVIFARFCATRFGLLPSSLVIITFCPS